MTGELWGFIGASLLLALTPGPDIITVIVRSVTQGIGAGLAATAGFASGLTVHTTLAAAGVAALLAASPGAMRTIRWLGAAYLLYLAVRTALGQGAISLDAAEPTNPSCSLARVYGQSVIMNVLNPKVTLFFLGFLPGFVDQGPKPALQVWAQMVMLGVIFACCTVACFGTCAFFAGGISRWLRRRNGATKMLRWATALLFAGIALWLVGSGLLS